ncbi:hypothetical protein FS749_006782 [Ceratobasidium sp. UAMH 11750]|nr:hypothetical protein FS749_006782 [Ceratobasidium sp. UAMH 11750]
MGDLLQTANEYGISPTKLRNYVELIVRTRWSVYGEREAESNVSSTQESAVSRPLSARVPPTLVPRTLVCSLFAAPFLSDFLVGRVASTWGMTR